MPFLKMWEKNANGAVAAGSRRFLCADLPRPRHPRYSRGVIRIDLRR
jgi:hypothetical protein